MMQDSCRLCRCFPDLFLQKTFFTVQALHFPLICNDQYPATVGTRRRNGPFPGGKITGGIISTTVEYSALTRLALDYLSTIFRTFNTDLFQPRLSVPAG